MVIQLQMEGLFCPYKVAQRGFSMDGSTVHLTCDYVVTIFQGQLGIDPNPSTKISKLGTGKWNHK